MTVGEFMQQCSHEDLVDVVATLMALGYNEALGVTGSARLNNDMLEELAASCFRNFARVFLSADASNLGG